VRRKQNENSSGQLLRGSIDSGIRFDRIIANPLFGILLCVPRRLRNAGKSWRARERIPESCRSKPRSERSIIFETFAKVSAVRSNSAGLYRCRELSEEVLQLCTLSKRSSREQTKRSPTFSPISATFSLLSSPSFHLSHHPA